MHHTWEDRQLNEKYKIPQADSPAEVAAHIAYAESHGVSQRPTLKGLVMFSPGYVALALVALVVLLLATGVIGRAAIKKIKRLGSKAKSRR